MPGYPAVIDAYFSGLVEERHLPAYLEIARDGRLTAFGGHLSHFRLDLAAGAPASEQAVFLEGMLPVEEALTLWRVEVTGGIYADVHFFRDGASDFVLLLDVTEDVRERAQIEQALRSAEEQLRHADKMEAIGRLAGGIAHDFTNLLSVIVGFAHIVIEEMHPGDPRLDDMQEISKAGNQALKLTRHLLAFSRKQMLQLVVLDLNSVVTDISNIVRRMVGEDIELVCHLEPGLALVEADRGEIEQVILNLAANARDAMPHGGRLTLDTRNVFRESGQPARFSPIRPPAADGVEAQPFAMLSITDTGRGMDADTRARAFEPFFTTKEQGKGTGLGLATVYGIVSQSGGEIQLESEPGKGTRFEIYLPRTVRQAEAGPAPAAQAQPVAGTETILVVEDEPGVRKLVTTLLRRRGYRVIEASNANEAMGVCAEHLGAIHLLITDVVMPGKNGMELAQSFVEMRPATRVLFVTGYAKDAITRRGLADPGAVVLRKPFSGDTLALRVREMLDEPRPAARSSASSF